MIFFHFNSVKNIKLIENFFFVLYFFLFTQQYKAKQSKEIIFYFHIAFRLLTVGCYFLKTNLSNFFGLQSDFTFSYNFLFAYTEPLDFVLLRFFFFFFLLSFFFTSESHFFLKVFCNFVLLSSARHQRQPATLDATNIPS